MGGSRPPFTLDQGRPVLPLLGDFRQNTTHDTGGSHETVAFAFEDSHLAAPHGLAEPLDILHRHASVFAAVLNDHRPGDINVAESDGLTPLKADQQINGWVGVGRGELPDLVSESGVVVNLPLAFVFGRFGTRAEGRIASSVRSLGNRCWLCAAQWRRVFILLLGFLGGPRQSIGRSRFRGFGTRCFFGSLAPLSPGRLGQTGSDASTGSTHEAGIGNLEKGCWEGAENSLRVGDRVGRRGFLVRADGR